MMNRQTEMQVHEDRPAKTSDPNEQTLSRPPMVWLLVPIVLIVVAIVLSR
jgi:hypothetical protein